jgi:hypothetical protein
MAEVNTEFEMANDEHLRRVSRRLDTAAGAARLAG